MQQRGISAILLLGAFGLLVVLIIGLALLPMQSRKDSAQSLKPTTTSVAKTTPYQRPTPTKKTVMPASPQALPTVDWQQYDGDHFSFAYPALWSVATRAAEDATVVTVTPPDQAGSQAGLFLQESPDSNAIAQGIDLTQTSLGYQKQQVVLGSIFAIKYEGTLPGTKPISEVSYIVRNKGLLFYIKYYFQPSESSAQLAALFNKIALSFVLK